MNDTCNPLMCRERAKYCDGRLEDTRKMFIKEIDNLHKSIDTAKAELERRLESMNEFRSQLEKQAKTFLDKGYYDLQHGILLDRLNSLQRSKDIQDGRSSISNYIAGAAILISLIFGMLHFVAGLR